MGFALMGGLSLVREPVGAALDSPAGDVAKTVTAIALLLLAAWYGLVKKPGTGESRLGHWREAAVGESATVRGVVAISLITIALEVPTMFPYLAAIDRLTHDEYSWLARGSVLALYCLVMVTPAAIAVALRTVFSRAMVPVLNRVDRWLRDGAREDAAWLLALAGVLILSTTTLYERVKA